jgi:hypothetical protein
MNSLIVHPKTEAQEKALKAIFEAMEVLYENSEEQFADSILNESTSEYKRHRTPGLAKGLIKMRDNFDEPLDDFKEYQ